MPTGMTYDSLKTDLVRFLERGASLASDPVVFAEIPRIITLAEIRCAKELKILGYETSMTSDFVAGTSVYAKPALWRETISVNFGAGTSPTFTRRTFLFPRSYEYCRNYWPVEAETDVPEFYADYDANHWLIAPTPDQAYPYEIIVYVQPAMLDDVTSTNWLTDYAQDLLLKASLLEMSLFLGNVEYISKYQPDYDRCLASTNGEDMQKILDRSISRKRT